MTFHVPKEDSDGYINNKKNMYKFQFDNVFDDKTQQDVIFDRVGLRVGQRRGQKGLSLTLPQGFSTSYLN